VVASVEPLTGKPQEPVTPPPFVSSEVEKPASTRSEPKGFATSLEANGATKKSQPASNTLDGSWDRRLSRGMVAPELAVDLHGHTLDTAYRTLDAGLESAIARGVRVLLLVTGKPRGPGSGRGAIRAAVGDWLTASRHSADIAAVRGAHPRHGGTGALYIVLKRNRAR
jgi:DNA-nicking Smr family endonuclease